MAAVLLFGPGPASLLGFLVYGGNYLAARKGLFETLFNSGQLALSLAVSGSAYIAVAGGEWVKSQPLHFLGFAAAAVTYFVVNSLLVATIVSLAEHHTFASTWLTLIQAPTPAIMVLGAPLALLYRYEPWSILLVIVPYLFVYFSFKARATNLELDRRVGELERISWASENLGATLNRQDAVQVIHRILADMFSFDRMEIWLERNGIRELIRHDDKVAFVSDISLFWKVLADQRAPFIVHDIRKYPFPGLALKQGSLLLFPLLMESRPWGTILVYTDQANRYTAEARKAASALAGPFSACLKNAELYEAIRRVGGELTQVNSRIQIAQHQTHQASKAAAFGQLAAGVAHEVNNPLVAVLANLQLLQMTTGIPARDTLTKLIEQADSCRGVVERLLRYSRKSLDSPLPADLALLTREVSGLLSHPLRALGIELSCEVGSFPAFPCVENALSQALTYAVLAAKEILLSRLPEAASIKVKGQGGSKELCLEVVHNGDCQGLHGNLDPVCSRLSLCEGLIKGQGGEFFSSFAPGEPLVRITFTVGEGAVPNGQKNTGD
ncbi:MAG: hypothetical protein HYU64_04045 [Armatimonadetes bacterium]|nr:hypothetical protein [Armatimonadota bacterium]